MANLTGNGCFQKGNAANPTGKGGRRAAIERRRREEEDHRRAEAKRKAEEERFANLPEEDRFIDDDPDAPEFLKDLRWARANYGTNARGTLFQEDLRRDARADRQKFCADLAKAEAAYARMNLGLAPEKEGVAAESALGDPGAEKSLQALDDLLKGFKMEAEMEDVEPE